MIYIKAGLSLIANAVIVFATLGIVARYHLKSREREKPEVNLYSFFTTDSNVLGALCALPAAYYAARTLLSGAEAAPVWAVCLKYVSAAALTLTLCTVVFYLTSVYSLKELFGGGNLWLHLITPLLSLISFLALDPGGAMPWPLYLTGVIPTALYGVIYVINVKFRKRWPDFYGFLRFRYWPVTFLAMFVSSGALCLIISILHLLIS